LSGQPARRYPAFLLAIVIVVVLVSASLFLTIGQASKSPTASTTSGTATVNTSTMTVNGSQYYADNVTKIMNTQGTTFHLDNGSVTFRGVEFQTICTDYSSGCPGVPPPPANTTYTLPSGPGITLNVTFPDHSSEMIVFPIVVHFYAFSNHANPRAGILFVYATSGSGIKSYLLVSTSVFSTSSGAGISSDIVVATVTVTETSTTQASQATTTYAIPTANCTFSPVVTTTITTITVGPTPPASTTTTTVTTTSTSYTQTVTVTSCTYSMPTMVTSTVTTTANP
jgi:hypothetical protein